MNKDVWSNIIKQTRTLTLGALHFNTQLSGVVSDATSGPSGAPGASRNKQKQIDIKH